MGFYISDRITRILIRSDNENINYEHNLATNLVRNYPTSESYGDVNSVPIRDTTHGQYPSQQQTNSHQFISNTQNVGDDKEKKLCTTPSHIPYVPTGQTYQHRIAGIQTPVGTINTPNRKLGQPIYYAPRTTNNCLHKPSLHNHRM